MTSTLARDLRPGMIVRPSRLFSSPQRTVEAVEQAPLSHYPSGVLIVRYVERDGLWGPGNTTRADDPWLVEATS